MAIEVFVKANGFTVNDRLDEYVRSKAMKLDRYIEGLDEARIELTSAQNARLVTDQVCGPDHAAWEEDIAALRGTLGGYLCGFRFRHGQNPAPD